MDNLTNDVIIHKKVNETEVICFRKLLEFPNLKHCYTLRRNDINVQIIDGDKTKLLNSYEKIAKAMDINKNNIIKPHQTHTDNIEIVNGLDEEFNDVDGLITNKKNIFLCTTSADCISLLFYDANKQIIANVHSGWRGTLKQISKKAVEKMISKYGSNPQDILCCICPSIRKCHFEVDEDVMELFKEEFTYTGKIDRIIEKGRVYENIQKYNIDTVMINKIILEEVGLKKENILDSGICTVCNSKEFHSYRADGKCSGRNGAFIGME